VAYLFLVRRMIWQPRCLLLGVILAAATRASATPPAQLRQELAQVTRRAQIVTSVAALPAPLKASLAKTFHQKSLQLGNPSDLIGGSVTYTGDPARNAPYRRLVFAFETPSFYVVYYEHGDPENSQSALAFTKSHHPPKFAWGGADLKSRARSPREIATRILKGKVWDDKPYIW
jgi:hypothetical protein